MHESSLTSGLLRKIETLAAVRGGAAPLKVHVVLGALSNISAGHFREHFVQAARGTICERADLAIREDDDIQAAHALDVMLESVEFDA